MAALNTGNVNESTPIGTSLQGLLMADDIQPGSTPSYEVCKIIYSFHPLGQKLVESPVKLAQSQARDINISDAPDQVKEAFLKEWLKIDASRHIRNLTKTSRMYGIASMALLQENVNSSLPIEFDKLYNTRIAINIFDPLNTAGSLVLSQVPNAFDYQKHDDIVVSGQVYHRSRSIVMLNEEPVYIEYTTSAFGFVGRSIYQRALYPLKSFVQTMITDDLVTLKAGVIVAKMKQVSSAVNNVMTGLFNIKRNVVKEAVVRNVISIAPEEDIQTLNMQNLDGAYSMARNNILKNIATAADMPAKFLDQETMVEGFGEGTEDAKNIARYVDGLREQMAPAYSWFDKIVQHRAWNPDFYATIQKMYPDRYGKVEYEEAFYQWSNSFEATWPSLLIEPDSEKAKTEDVKLKGLIAVIQVLLPSLDPENKAEMLQWAQDNLNVISLLFPLPLNLDFEALKEFIPENMTGGNEEDAPPPAPPFSARDSAGDSKVALLR